MAKVYLTPISKTEYAPSIVCPACGYGHMFDSRWSWNGNMEKPTFRPSMLTNSKYHSEHAPRCHSFVTDGKDKIPE